EMSCRPAIAQGALGPSACRLCVGARCAWRRHPGGPPLCAVSVPRCLGQVSCAIPLMTTSPWSRCWIAPAILTIPNSATLSIRAKNAKNKNTHVRRKSRVKPANRDAADKGTGWNIPVDQAHGTHRRSIANDDTRQDCHVRPDAHVLADDDR